jgi:outer membrane protein insertion porin family
VLRTNIGFLKGYKENTFVPYSERFMPGGTSWDGFVRGYSNRQVCPRLRGEEIGGETMLVNNIEFQIPIVAQMLYGILFYDFGNAWRNLSETNPFDVKRSFGIGARVLVPSIGLVGFDLGYGMDKLEGANKVGGWRPHFQFGTMW